MRLRTALKQAALTGAHRLGIVHATSLSRWRRERLLILCYHGLSLRDEHRWNGMYVTREFFERRLVLLRLQGYHVLPLDEAIQRLHARELPRRSVVITFDDGFYDFRHHAVPAVETHRVPVTLYLTTYYADHPYPVFNLILSYLFWRAAGRVFDGSSWGLSHQCQLRENAEQNYPLVRAILHVAKHSRMVPSEKNALAASVARQVGVDFEELMEARLLHLMNSEEVGETIAAGIDVQLHTHRHRAPAQADLFHRELHDNQRWIREKAGIECKHFCYPSGEYRQSHLDLLRRQGIVSATTCDHALASPADDPLLLPRFLDSMRVSETEFLSWASGFSNLLPHRRSYVGSS